MSTEKEKKDRVSRIARIFIREHSIFSKEYDAYEEGYHYLAGEQYTPDVKEWWESQRRPTRVYNLVFPTFNQVLGDFLINEQRVKAYPRPGGTNEIAGVYDKLIEHTNIENDHRRFLGRWALAGLIKRGFAFPRFSDELEMDGSLVISDIDEFEVGFDSRAQNYFLDDAQYVYRSRWLDKNQLISMWPHHKRQLNEFLAERERGDFWDGLDESTSLLMDSPHFVYEKDGKYRVIEFHEMEYDSAEVAIDTASGDMEVFTLEGRKADLFRKTHPNHRFVQRNNVKIKKITSVLPGLMFELEHKRADLQDQRHDIIPFSAYDYAKHTKDYFGLFNNIKDPQDGFNEWQNTSEDVIKRMVDPGHTYNPSKLENPQDVENYGRMPGVNFRVESEVRDINSVIQLNKVAGLPAGMAPDRITGLLAEYVEKVSGVRANLMGASENASESGRLFGARVRQAKVSLEVIHHNMASSKRRLYNKAIRLIQENYTTERYFSITSYSQNTGALDTEELIINQRLGDQVLNDITVGRYAVIAEDMDRNPTARAIRFMQKTELTKMLYEMLGPGAIDPEWWLSEADLGDIQQLIQRAEMTLQQMGQQGEQQEAFQATEAIQKLAQQQLALRGDYDNNNSGFSSNGPGANNKSLTAADSRSATG